MVFTHSALTGAVPGAYEVGVVTLATGTDVVLASTSIMLKITGARPHTIFLKKVGLEKRKI